MSIALQNVTLQYTIGAGVTSTDPGSGNMCFNTPTQSDATELYLSRYEQYNIDVSDTIAGLNPGDLLDFTEPGTSKGCNYAVTAVTNNTSWFTIEVTAGLSTGLPFDAGATVTVDVVSGAPSPSETCGGCSYAIDRSVPSGTTTVSVLECRVNPPTVQGSKGVWPQILPTDWCGEYKAKTKS